MALSACSSACAFGMAVEQRDADRGAGTGAAAAEFEREPSIACSSAAAFARASVSLRFHNSSANSSPPSRPITSEARTWRNSVCDDRLQHLVACSVAERIVDRLETIDVEHQHRATRLVTLDEGNRAGEFALEAAPVEDVEQEIGLGGGLELLDLGPRLRQFLAQPPHGRLCRLGMPGSSDRAAARLPRARSSAGLRAGRAGFRGALAAFEAAAPVFFLLGIFSRRLAGIHQDRIVHSRPLATPWINPGPTL